MINLGEVEFRVGANERAVEYAQEAAKGLRSAGLRSQLAWALVNLAGYLVIRGEHADARASATEALSLLREDGGFWLRVCLQLWALLGAVEGQYTAAAQLKGFVDAGYARSGEIRHRLGQQICDLLSTTLAANVTPDDVEAWVANGAGWSERHAVDFTQRRIVSRETSATR